MMWTILLSCLASMVYAIDDLTKSTMPHGMGMDDYLKHFTGKYLPVARQIISKKSSFPPVKTEFMEVVGTLDDGFHCLTKGTKDMTGQSECFDLAYPSHAASNTKAQFVIPGTSFYAVVTSRPEQYCWVFICRDNVGNGFKDTCRKDDIDLYLLKNTDFNQANQADIDGDLSRMKIHGDSDRFVTYEHDESQFVCTLDEAS